MTLADRIRRLLELDAADHLWPAGWQDTLREAARIVEESERDREWINEQRVLLMAALIVMRTWDGGLDEQDGPEYWNAQRDWQDCLAALCKWEELDAARASGGG